MFTLKFAQAFAILSLVCLDSTVSAARVFNAAPKSNHLRRRDANFEPRMDDNVLYFTEDFNGVSSPAAVRVALTPKFPTLIHEDVSSHLAGIDCSNGNILVKFHAEDAMIKARDVWNTNSDFVFITSQPSCASRGEHTAYIVSFMEAQSPKTITLKATGTTLRDSTHSMYVDMGSHLVSELDSRVEPHMIKRGDHAAMPSPPPEAAQAEPVTTPTATSTNWQTAAPLTQTIDWVTPTEEASSSDVVADISFERIDTVLLPPGGDISPFLPAADIINNFELRCANCSLTGTLELDVAGFNVDSNAFEAITEFVDNGFFEFTARGVSGTFEFDFVIQQGFAVPFLDALLPSIPLTPLAIPGVVNFGPVLELTFPIAITLDRDVTFTTGFTLTVPEESKVVLNISDIASSTSVGFQDSVLDPLPFNTDVDDLAVEFTAGFRPQLLLNAGVGNDLVAEVSGGVGVFLDIPELSVTVSSLENQNPTCDGPAPAGETNRRILIESEATVRAGGLFQFELSLGFLDFGREGEQELASFSVPLLSQCLLFNQETQSLDAPPAPEQPADQPPADAPAAPQTQRIKPREYTGTAASSFAQFGIFGTSLPYVFALIATAIGFSVAL